MSTSLDAAAQQRRAVAAPDPIRYTLSFPAPQTHYVEVEATVPTGGRPQIELEMAVWTPGSYLVREFSRHVEESDGTRRWRDAARREDGQESMARADRRRATVDRPVSRVRPGDERPHELHRRGLRAHQRRGDVPYAGRRHDAAPARGRAVPARRVEDDNDRLAGVSRRPGASLPRRGLRHAGRFADRRRQPRGVRVHGEGQAPLPRQRRGGRNLGRPAVGRRRAEDRAGTGRVLGRPARTTSTCSST